MGGQFCGTRPAFKMTEKIPLRVDWQMIDILYQEMVSCGQPDPKVKALFLAVAFIQDLNGKKHVIHDIDIEEIVKVFNQIIERENKETLQ